MRTNYAKVFVAAAISIGAAVMGCSHDTRHTAVSPTPPSAGMAGAKGHWVHDQQLRQLMAALKQQAPTMPAGVPEEPESAARARSEDFDAVAMLAGELESAAGHLPDVASRLKMQEADRGGFLGEAMVLREQAGRLRDAARKHRIEQMQVQMAAINATCVSCHSRFRDFSGQLNPSQALMR